MVDEDAGEPIPHRTVHQRRRHRRVDTPGEAGDHLLIAHLLPDIRHGLVDDRLLGPIALGAAGCGEEPFQNLLAVVGVHHLRMELHAVELALGVLHRRHR